MIVKPFSENFLTGVACLIPVEQALHDAAGNVISGGLFAVPHKAETDRIILDRRPQNELERRLVMARLPHGSLLTQLILPKGFSIRGSGDDLSNFFYLLKHTEEWLGRNCVGEPFDGGKFTDWGGKKVASTCWRFVLSLWAIVMLLT